VRSRASGAIERVGGARQRAASRFILDEDLVARVQDREAAVILTDDAFDDEAGPDLDARYLTTSEEDDGDAAGAILDDALEGRNAGAGTDPNRVDPSRDPHMLPEPY
jgi:hypothetical protein